jgi:hypothetical protein
MPIRFRCSYCNRLLGIATRKAGTQTICPHCGYQIIVPVPQDDEARTDRLNLDDRPVLARGATEVMAEPAVATAPPVEQVEEKPEKARPAPAVQPKHSSPEPPAAPKSRPVLPPVSKPAKSNHPEERSLFEGDIDEILGPSGAREEPERAKPPATSGMDALSLGEPARHIVISAQKATLFMVVVVILLALAFAAGYFLAPKG